MSGEKTIDVTEESSGDSVNLPNQTEIDSIIRHRVYAAAAAGLVPVPLFDIGALAVIHTEMLYRLCKAYNQPYTAEWGKKSIGIITGSLLPVLLAPGLGKFLRFVPGIGQALNITSLAILNAAATYAVGEAFARHFASGGTFLNCDIENLSREVKANFEKAKTTVREWFDKKDKPEPVFEA